MAVKRQPLRGQAIKSLQYFLNRSVVLTQYRQFLRATQPLEKDVRRDVRRQIRSGFEMYRDLEDDKQVNVLLRQAKDQLKMVEDLVDTALARQRVAADNGSITKNLATQVSQASDDSNSNGTWMDGGTGNDEEDRVNDVKGRVGVGWPWKKSKSPAKLELEGIKRR